MFTIVGLDPQPFQHYFDGAQPLARRVISTGDGFPCRVSLVDAPAGEELVLLHYLHHDADTPYRSSGPIYIRRGAEQAVFHDAVPPLFRTRIISLRAYSATGYMRDAAISPGTEIEPAIARLFADPKTAYLHAHYAQTGCFAARIERA